MQDLPTGTVTFLFTDIEASTRLLQSMSEDAYAAVLADHHAILREAFVRSNGREVDTQGDAIFAVFARAADAVAAAVAAQRAFASLARVSPHRDAVLQAHADGGEPSTMLEPVRTLTETMRVRVGIHTGEATLGPTGYVGVDVHRAARISAIGHGGQVLLSEAATALARNDLPTGVSLRDLGMHRLKDLQALEHIYQLLIPGLPSDFPPLTSLNVIANNLPVQLTEFIGREAEIKDLACRLCPQLDPALKGQRPVRLLTLMGTGGTGKTRLALQVAAELLGEFADGVWLIELAPLADPQLIAQAIANALHVAEQPGRPLIDTVTDALRAKNTLLILDNCEHLIDAAAQVANMLLRAAPGVKILATSREGLGIAGETAYRVPSLSLPEPRGSLENILRCESVHLFLNRAVAVQPRFQVTSQNAAAVAQIVRRLDGIPLAIELAAARVKLFSAEQIAARLDDHFRLLTGGSRTALPRQQTLRALIDWSYDLLSENERKLLRRMAVFVGGCTFEAVEAICGEGLDVLDLLEHLVDKSLVLVDEGESTTRYRLLEMIRQYGRDKLLESRESELIRDRHLDYYHDLFAPADGPTFLPRDRAFYALLRPELDNVRAAVGWGIERYPYKAMRLASLLASPWQRIGVMSESLDWLEQALVRTEGPLDLSTPERRVQASTRAGGLRGAGMLKFALGMSKPAREQVAAGLEIYRRLEDGVGIAMSTGMLGLVDRFLGNDEAALAETEQALQFAREAGTEQGIIMALNTRARMAAEIEHDPIKARALIDEAISRARSSGNRWFLGLPLYARGMLAFAGNDYATATRSLEESMQVFREEEDDYFCSVSRSGLAETARLRGDLERAARLHLDTLNEWNHIGHLGGLARALETLAFIARAQAERMDGDVNAALERRRRAARLFGAAESLRRQNGSVMMREERAEYEEEVASLKAKMGSAELDEEWARGAEMSQAEAVAYARAG